MLREHLEKLAGHHVEMCKVFEAAKSCLAGMKKASQNELLDDLSDCCDSAISSHANMAEVYIAAASATPASVDESVPTHGDSFGGRDFSAIFGPGDLSKMNPIVRRGSAPLDNMPTDIDAKEIFGL